MQYGYCICLKWDESLYPIQSNRQHLIYSRKRLEARLLQAIATSKYASCGAFLSVQRACQIPIVLHHYLQRYSLLCVSTLILSHLTTSSVPNLHNAKIVNISGTRGDMTKRKMPFFFTFKAFQISLFFNSSIFHFRGTLRVGTRYHMTHF